jgi:hypothetical protein
VRFNGSFCALLGHLPFFSSSDECTARFVKEGCFFCRSKLEAGYVYRQKHGLAVGVIVLENTIQLLATSVKKLKSRLLYYNICFWLSSRCVA